MPDEFLTRLSNLGNKTDAIIERVLEAGGKVALAKVQSNLHSVLSGESSRQLECSLGLSPAKLDSSGNYDVKVGFAENRNDGKSNAMLANLLEYGKSGQPPKPFLAPAKSASKGECISTMKAKMEEEIGGI